MAGVGSPNLPRPTTSFTLPLKQHSSTTRRYPNQARPHGPAASEFGCGVSEFRYGLDPNWEQFKAFLLQRMNEKTAEDRLRYAKQYYYVLEQEKETANTVLQLSPNKRIHVMKALSNLAKFTGKYDVWLQLQQRYNLKWSTGNEALDTFERFFDDNKTLDTMLHWLKQMRQTVPKAYSDFFVFCTLTGLRASECVACIRLIKDPGQFKSYYNEGRQCLEHFRFSQIFIRRTKAAYISLVDKEIR
jgi:hypothetical protein